MCCELLKHLLDMSPTLAPGGSVQLEEQLPVIEVLHAAWPACSNVITLLSC